MFDRITFDPQIMGRRASVRGMGIGVANSESQIAHCTSNEEILANFSYIEKGDVQQAQEYAAELPYFYE